MRICDLDYDLPPELVAQAPLPERDGSRLLCLDAATGGIRHRRFGDLPGLLPDGAMIVVNDSRVFPARIACRKRTGGRAEALLVRRIHGSAGRERWLALVGAGGRVREGMILGTPTLSITIAGRHGGEGQRGDPLFLLDIEALVGTVADAIAREGTVPLPPYISRAAEASDAERYQTIYAAVEGSAAAPTAGLHFTSSLLSRLEAAGHPLFGMTLHVGPGTFLPVRTAALDDHVMYGEWARIPEATAIGIEAGRRDGRSLVAVGTTVVRTLESVAERSGAIVPWEGEVNAFIRPGHRFAAVDHLITNFHLPRTTLLALVMALAGRDRVMAAYSEAVRERYRFYSYGDAMLVLARPPD